MAMEIAVDRAASRTEACVRMARRDTEEGREQLRASMAYLSEK